MKEAAGRLRRTRAGYGESTGMRTEVCREMKVSDDATRPAETRCDSFNLRFSSPTWVPPAAMSNSLANRYTSPKTSKGMSKVSDGPTVMKNEKIERNFSRSKRGSSRSSALSRTLRLNSTQINSRFKNRGSADSAIFYFLTRILEK